MGRDDNRRARPGDPVPTSPTQRLDAVQPVLEDLLAGRYRIIRLLGQGGMGAVYEAEDRELGITVALKMVRPDITASPETLRRLKREVLLARQVSHPNVCRLHDLGRDTERELFFCTMELLRGEDLAQRLGRQGPMGVEEVLPLARHMARGLQAAHAAGVVHRDFKSANVMLVPSPEGERAVITDFGIAVGPAGELSETAGSGWVVGTPQYMAPEQVRGERVGPAADVYALGVVLFEMVTRRRPFEGKQTWPAAQRKLVEDAPSVREIDAELPVLWNDVIARCLAREAGARFGRVEDVAAALGGEVVLERLPTRAPVRAGHCLPAERDVFVGREKELGDLEKRLDGDVRLLTLLGPAGTGKTRLAVRHGRQHLDRFPGGVWFCDLSEARSIEGIATAVATALDVPLGRDDPVVQLGHAIAGRGRCMAILDNFEQVVAHAAETAGRWVERAEEARFLVTSRERLHLPGEEIVALEPLGGEEGAELFLARARAQRPGFDPRGEEREAVERVVRRLDGLPLAIELAAARVRVMGPEQIADRVSDRFRLLAGGEKGSRHATLRAAIDGSWELLEPWEKSGFAQASVFEGGFTLEAAEAVLDLEAWEEAPWVVDVVQALVDKSLLRIETPEGAAGEPRFGMYVSLQEYAREKLGEEEAGGAEERHGRHYARFGTDEEIGCLDRHGGLERRRRLAKELENLVAACRRAVERGDGETAAAVLGGAWAVLEMQGPLGMGLVLGREVLAIPGLAPSGRARALRAVANALQLAGRMEEARDHYQSALAIHREIGDRGLEGNLLANVGLTHQMQGRTEEAREYLEQALAVHGEAGDHRSEGVDLGNLGNLHLSQGRMEEARDHYERALAVHREVGDRRFEGVVLGNLGVLHGDQGRMEEARRSYEQSLAIAREVGSRRSEGNVLGNLGDLCGKQERMEEAREHYERALVMQREVGDRRLEGIALGNLGEIHARTGRLDEARHAFAAGENLLREVSDKIGLATLLCARGEMEARAGDLAAARATFEEVSSLAEALGVGPDSGLGRALAGLGDTIAAAEEPS